MSSLDLDRIPRAIRFVRADASMAPIPEGYPVLILLDQSWLPQEEAYLTITDWRVALDAVKELKVRGAPALGIAAAAIMALRAAEFVYASADAPQDAFDFDRVFVIDAEGVDPELFRTGMAYAAEMVKGSRPTAVNLFKGVDACMQVVAEELRAHVAPAVIADELFELACSMILEDEERNRLIGSIGKELLAPDSSILTHCNAGSLATGFYGTALGVVYAGAEAGRIKHVYADETRPVCQGSRLTAWELARAGVPVTLICDDMAASVMAQGKVDAVIVGADRIAANGDVANKIGTLGVAVLAQHFGIPFYVAAPTSTIDADMPDGACIPIEERASEEVLLQPIEGVSVCNPAFDVTPACLVTSIITERGAFAPQDILKALE